jgi:hypothetical protein
VQPSPAEISSAAGSPSSRPSRTCCKHVSRRPDPAGRLQEILATVRDRLEGRPDARTELTELMRDYQTLKDTYTSLLTKSQESNIAA